MKSTNLTSVDSYLLKFLFFFLFDEIVIILFCIHYIFIQKYFEALYLLRRNLLRFCRIVTNLLQILGDKLYIRPEDDAGKPLPSPNALKNKFLLRGKKLSSEPSSDRVDSRNGGSEEQESDDDLDVEFSRLISIPAAKLSANIRDDIQKREQVFFFLVLRCYSVFSFNIAWIFLIIFNLIWWKNVTSKKWQNFLLILTDFYRFCLRYAPFSLKIGLF